MVRRWRKPLVVLTPKSLLRHPKALSSLEELANGTFCRVMPDRRIEGETKTSRILLCSGKIYYDLLEFREREKRDDVAIVRVEQFYPLPDEALQDVLKSFPNRNAGGLGARGTTQHGRPLVLVHAIRRSTL